MWEGIVLDQSKALRAKVRDWNGTTMPSAHHVTRLAREFDEDPEYVEICFRERVHENRKGLVDQLSRQERQFVRMFMGTATDRWLARQLRISVREAKLIREQMARRST